MVAKEKYGGTDAWSRKKNMVELMPSPWGLWLSIDDAVR
jgi:hypothetical protein